MITKLLRIVIVCNELLNQIVAYVPVAFESLNRVSFKLDQNIGNFLVRSLSQTNDQSKISGPKRSIKITEHFTCFSANVNYFITCTEYNKICLNGETGRQLDDRLREHLRDVGRNDKDASKPVARPFYLPNHFGYAISLFVIVIPE